MSDQNTKLIEKGDAVWFGDADAGALARVLRAAATSSLPPGTEFQIRSARRANHPTLPQGLAWYSANRYEPVPADVEVIGTYRTPLAA